MKRGLFIIVTLIVAMSSFAQKKYQLERSGVDFDEVEFDLGVLPSDTTVCHAFWFTNNTGRPFVISYIENSCGCISAEYSKKPVMDGECGVVYLTLAPTVYAGQIIRKAVTIYSDNKTKRDILVLRATVVEKKKSRRAN